MIIWIVLIFSPLFRSSLAAPNQSIQQTDMVSSKYLPLILSIAILSVTASASVPEALSQKSSYGFPTAYEVLDRLSFPVGILPQGVESYLLTPDGSFEVFLAATCQFKVAGEYLLKYPSLFFFPSFRPF